MATRRTALPRTTRAPSVHAPPPQAAGTSRTRSALSRPSSAALRSERTTPFDEPAEAPHPTRTSRTATINGTSDSSESNIQVVIRCRRRSEREIEENSPIIVSTKGAKGEDITIETAAPVSSLGVVTLAPTRTYPFDLVFGPEADQTLIYHEVVSPMLEEVLQGYNCTLFAYGQTGTGKT
jgi:kinesin family member 11